MDAYEWGPAEVMHPDWKGTAQIEEKLTGDESIYTISGVDRNEWTIIGIDLNGGESGFHSPRIVVVPRGSDLDSGRIEAKMIRLHEVTTFDLLSRIIHLFGMTLRTRRVESAEIVITSVGDIPPQQ